MEVSFFERVIKTNKNKMKTKSCKKYVFVLIQGPKSINRCCKGNCVIPPIKFSLSGKARLSGYQKRDKIMELKTVAKTNLLPKVTFLTLDKNQKAIKGKNETNCLLSVLNE